MTTTFLRPAILLLLFYPLQANTGSRRANITGGGGSPRCRIEVNVDHAAELEIFGDTGNLRTLGGQPAFWQRFDCNVPLPRMPRDFRLARVNGRGPVRLLKDPSSNGGTALIHMSDPQRGRGWYSIELAWSPGGPAWGPALPPYNQGPHGGVWQATQRCQDVVSDRLHRQGYRSLSFGRPGSDPYPGPRARISGVVTAKRGLEASRFSFSCSIDPRFGDIRHADLRRN